MSIPSKTVSVIGAGPAGLMAAETLARAGLKVTIHDRMPSAGRKFLMAGRGGLNLTHSEAAETFGARYGEAADWMAPYLAAYSPADLTAWATDLGQETFTGSSGRVFPRAMKASPLLRAWLVRLGEMGVTLKLRSAWRGWTNDGALAFEGGETETPDAVVLALGGASWPRLGSDGGWAPLLSEKGVTVTPLAPSNVGFDVPWTLSFRERFSGQPLKAIAITHGDQTIRGEAMIARYGLEGGLIYALSPGLRAAIAAEGEARIVIDLRPDQSVGQVTGRLARPRGSQSFANHLRKAGGLSPAAVALLRESTGGSLPDRSGDLARLVKAVPLTLTGMQGLDRAISSAGGIARDELDAGLMLKKLPGVFAAGEMLDWEAPTGGYLLQGSFSTGDAAAKGVIAYLG